MIKDIQTNNSTLVLFENGDLWGCGANKYGELGLGNVIQVDTLTKICSNVDRIKHSYHEIFVFKKDKSLWHAGSNFALKKKQNFFGLRKIDDNVKNVLNWGSPYSSEDFLFCLKNNGDLVDLVRKKVFLTNVKDIKSVDKKYKINGKYLFVLTEDNSLWQFKKTSFIKVLDDVKDIFSGYKDSFFVQKIDGSLWQVKENNFKEEVKLFNDIKDIKVYENSCLFLRENGDLFVLGSNKYSKLGTEKKWVRVPILVCKDVKSIYIGKYFSIVLKNDNTLWGCGKDYENLLKKNLNQNFSCFFKKIDDNVKKIYTDDNSLCIIKQNDELWGSGEIASYFQGNNLIKFISKNVKGIFFDKGSFFLLKKDNSLLCFGYNECGKLGLNTNKIIVKKPTLNNIIKNYYTIKETVEVINNVFKEKGL